MTVAVDGLILGLTMCTGGAFFRPEDTDRLAAADMPSQQAKGAAALAETAAGNPVTREYLDLPLGEIRAEAKAELAETKAEILRYIIGAIGFQTVDVIRAVAALIRPLHSPAQEVCRR
jgi:hypothetical protein